MDPFDLSQSGGWKGKSASRDVRYLCHDRVRVRSTSHFLYDDAIALKGGVGLVGW